MENKLNTQAIIRVHSTEWFNSFPVFKKKIRQKFWQWNISLLSQKSHF